jgi:hypothetical protein
MATHIIRTTNSEPTDYCTARNTETWSSEQISLTLHWWQLDLEGIRLTRQLYIQTECTAESCKADGSGKKQSREGRNLAESRVEFHGDSLLCFPERRFLHEHRVFLIFLLGIKDVFYWNSARPSLTYTRQQYQVSFKLCHSTHPVYLQTIRQ